MRGRANTKMKKRIALIGNNAGMVALCDFFREHDEVTVIALIHSDKPGSEQIAEKYAEEFGIERIWHPSRKNADQYKAFLDKISKLNLDLAICYSYDRIFDKAFLDIFNGEVYNFHGALLPKYRGQNTLNWVLVNGEEYTGMTLHRMDEGIDTGPIVSQKKIIIEQEDTAPTLQLKLHEAVRTLLSDFLPDIVNDSITCVPQDDAQATYVHKRRPSDGEIDWNRPAIEIYNLIRALVAPWPGAFYMRDNKKYVIDSFMTLDDVIELKEQMNKDANKEKQ